MRAFTLIELLIVVAIIGVVSVVVVLVLNPAELIRQSRDANRLSDMATISAAVNLYLEDSGGTGTLGTASTSYISVADPSATSTAGDQCQGLGLPALATSSSQNWQCASSSTFRKVNATGWIPLNFSTLSMGSPMGQLPVDPMNQTSTNLFYSYSANGTQYAVTAILESQKYKQTYGTMPPSPYFPEVIIQGNTPSVSALYNPTGLVGYWPMDEGQGSAAHDVSGNGNNGALLAFNWVGGCKIAGCIQSAATSGVIFSTPASLTFDAPTITFIFWEDIPVLDYNLRFTVPSYAPPGSWGTYGLFNGSPVGGWAGTSGITGNPASYSTNIWYQIAITWNDTTKTTVIYFNGQNGTSGSYPSSTTIVQGSAKVFYIGEYAIGVLLDDMRVYNRVLSPAEILALYNAEK